MKKNHITQVYNNHNLNALIIPLKIHFIFFIFLAILFSSITLSAQDRKNIINLNELSSEKSAAFSSDNKDLKIDVQKVKSLAVDLHPSVYLENGEINFYDQNPTTAFLDLQAFNSPISSDPRFASVEFLSLRINQIPVLNNISINNLKSFPNLKYIFFECNFECNENQFKNTLAILSNNYTIIYRVEVIN